MAKIDDDEVLPGVNLLFQFFDSNPCDAEFTHEALASQEFVTEIRCERAEKDQDEPASERSSALRDAFNLAAENITQSQESASPEHRAGAVENQKASEAHLKDTGQRRGDGAEAGKELGEDEGTCTLLRENAFGAADAGVRLDGDFAEELKDFDAFAKAELIPE